MPLHERIAVGHACLRTAPLTMPGFVVAHVAWSLVLFSMILFWPTGLWVFPVLHALSCRAVFAPDHRWTLLHLGGAPGLVLWLMPQVLRHRSTLHATYDTFLRLPTAPTTLDLPNHRLMAPDTALDLSTGRLCGSHHAQLADLAQRTPHQAAEIRNLQEKFPGAVLVGDRHRVVLIDPDGVILGMKKVR